MVSLALLHLKRLGRIVSSAWVEKWVGHCAVYIFTVTMADTSSGVEPILWPLLVRADQ
jgi:hypothetical protein